MSTEEKQFTQIVKVGIKEDTCLAGIYVGPQTSAKKAKKELEKELDNREGRNIIVGDLNERHVKWKRCTNPRGSAVLRGATKKDVIVTAPPPLSCEVKGRPGKNS